MKKYTVKMVKYDEEGMLKVKNGKGARLRFTFEEDLGFWT